MFNLKNYGIVEGCLTRNVTVLDNSDGSKRTLLTVAVRNNWPNRDGNYDTQFINLEGFIPAEKGLGPYEFLHKGDLVCFEFSVRSSSYKKDGQTVFRQYLHIDQIAFRTSKAMTEVHAMKTEAEEASNADASSAA